MKGITLRDGFILRPAGRADAQGITDLIVACDLEDEDASYWTLEETLSEFEKPDFNPAEDAWVVTAPDGRVVGYGETWNRSEHTFLSGDGYVHPDYRGLGLGTAVLRRIEARAREHIPLAPGGAQVALRNGVSGSDRIGREMHEHEGYRPNRFFWRMRIDMQSPPEKPVWPQGVTVRSLVPGRDDRAVFGALENAFRDHSLFVPWDYEHWYDRHFVVHPLDPGLNFVAWAGDPTREAVPQSVDIAGAVLGHMRPDHGWVSQLGVQRDWRRKGLGLALLLHLLGAFFDRGETTVELGVDANSLTGATRLYERAGMRAVHEYVEYEKVLRDKNGR